MDGVQGNQLGTYCNHPSDDDREKWTVGRVIGAVVCRPLLQERDRNTSGAHFTSCPLLDVCMSVRNGRPGSLRGGRCALREGVYGCRPGPSRGERPGWAF